MISWYIQLLHEIPAPSPDTLSAEEAPRCSMHVHAVSACWTISWLALLFNEAINPTPHASLSSIRAAGTPCLEECIAYSIYQYNYSKYCERWEIIPCSMVLFYELQFVEYGSIHTPKQINKILAVGALLIAFIQTVS